MKMLYCSVHMAGGDFERVFERNKFRMENVAQKFHALLCSGLSKKLCRQMTVLSCPPFGIAKLWSKDEFSVFYYVPILGVPLLKFLFIWFYMIVFSLFWNFSHVFSRRIIYISATSLLKFFPVYLLSKMLFAKVVLITCDIPSMTFSQRVTNRDAENSHFKNIHLAFTNLVWHIASHFDYYVFLTEKMNTLVNKHRRPYVVIEGFADITMEHVDNDLEEKYDKFVIVYAGGLYEKYGVKMLIDAVESIDLDDVELWLMGRGEMEPLLKESRYSHVRFLGSKINSEVVAIECRASLLINPRFSDAEYTFYSFPSKVIEYMSTGTYTLITKLGGIPEEYFTFCGTIDLEDVEGVKDAILQAYALPKGMRHQLGLRAKQFVMENKNNVKQAEKLLDMLRMDMHRC